MPSSSLGTGWHGAYDLPASPCATPDEATDKPQGESPRPCRLAKAARRSAADRAPAIPSSTSGTTRWLCGCGTPRPRCAAPDKVATAPPRGSPPVLPPAAKAARCFVAASAPEMPSPTFGTGWHCGCDTSRTHASRRTKGPPRCKGKCPSPAVLRKPPAASPLDMPSWTSGTSQPCGRETTRAPCATPGEGAAGQRGEPA